MQMSGHCELRHSMGCRWGGCPSSTPAQFSPLLCLPASPSLFHVCHHGGLSEAVLAPLFLAADLPSAPRGHWGLSDLGWWQFYPDVNGRVFEYSFLYYELLESQFKCLSCSLYPTPWVMVLVYGMASCPSDEGRPHPFT